MATSTNHEQSQTAVVAGGNQTTTAQTAQNITGLSLAIAANETWVYIVHMKVGTSSAAGTQYAVNFPSGATVTADWFGTTSAATAFTNEQTTAAATLTATSFNTANLAAVAVGAFIDGRITVINGANAGTVQIQHAKTTSGTATVYAGASMIGFKNS